jgi:hypothetical protein
LLVPDLLFGLDRFTPFAQLVLRPYPVAGAAVRMDFRLQRRYGFWYATAFVVLLWIGVLQLVPDALLGPAMPCLLMADLDS